MINGDIMKYLFLKNKMELKKNIMRFYLIQVFILFLYLLLNGSVVSTFNFVQYAAILGLERIKGSYILNVILKITTYLSLIYIIIKIFVDSMLKTIEYIMLRIDSKKWILYEMLNFIFYIIIMRLFYNLLLFILFLIFKSEISCSNFIYLMTKDMLFFIILSLLLILFLNLFALKRNKKIVSIIPLFFLISSLFVNIYEVSFVILIIYFLILFILNIFLFKPSRFYDEYCKK